MGTGLIARPHNKLVDVNMTGPGGNKGDALGDVHGRQRFHTLVDLGGSLLVTGEPDEGKLRFDHARIDLADTDRLTEELHA
jgi:hypothetical protein